MSKIFTITLKGKGKYCIMKPTVSKVLGWWNWYTR